MIDTDSYTPAVANVNDYLSSTVVNNFREKTPGVSKINYRI